MIKAANSKVITLDPTFPSTVQNVIRLIIEQSKPKKMILFGSRARKKNRDNSDFNFCVVGKTCSAETWAKLLVEIENEPLTLFKIDLLEFESLSKIYQEQIQSEGKILYDRDIEF